MSIAGQGAQDAGAMAKKLVRLGLFLLLAYLFFRLASPGSEPARGSDPSLLLHRVWLAHLPADERDLVPHLFLFDKAGHRGGAFGVASAWRVATNRVRFRYDAPNLELEIPQRKVKGRVRAEIRACEDAPKPFDLCLVLSEGSRRLELYSRRRWKLLDDGPEGYEESPLERRLAAWVRAELAAGAVEAVPAEALQEAPGRVLFPGE